MQSVGSNLASFYLIGIHFTLKELHVLCKTFFFCLFFFQLSTKIFDGRFKALLFGRNILNFLLNSLENFFFIRSLCCFQKSDISCVFFELGIKLLTAFFKLLNERCGISFCLFDYFLGFFLCICDFLLHSLAFLSNCFGYPTFNFSFSLTT